MNNFILNPDNSGAIWTKIDLHLHSPGSCSFSIPPSKNPAEIAEMYVQQLIKEKIRIAAVTDYNQIRYEWFSLIKNKALEHNIKIFPGIELSVDEGKGGLHILLIFEQGINLSGVNDYLKSLDKNPGNELINAKDNRTHRDISPHSSKSVISFLHELKSQYNCLIIFPHPEDNKGLFKAFKPEQAIDYLKIADAIEPISEKTRNQIISTGYSKILNTLAIIENSDPKNIDEIGLKKRDNKNRTSFFKLSSASINGLKLALHDPSIRIRTYTPPEFKHDRISNITINGNFLKDTNINFNAEQNTLIGGRGVGKSAIIEAIRYAMGLEIYYDESGKKNFLEFVIGSGGNITLFFEKFYGSEKKMFTVKRILGKDTEIFDKDGMKTNLMPSDLFEDTKHPILLGQKELYRLTSEPSFILRFIDDLIGNDIQHFQLEFQQLIDKLNSNKEQLKVAKSKLLQQEEYEQRLKAVNDQIKTYEELGVTEKLKRYTDIISDEEVLKNSFQKIESILSTIQQQHLSHISNLNATISNLKSGKSESKDILHDFATKVEPLKLLFDSNYKKIIEDSNKICGEKRDYLSTWCNNKIKIEEEANRIKQELTQNDLKPDDYERLVIEQTRLNTDIADLKTVKQANIDLINERERLKNAITQNRNKIFSIRKKRIDEINKILKGRLLLEVKYQMDRKLFGENISTLLSGSNTSRIVKEKLINAKEKLTDGILLSNYILKGKEAFKSEFDISDAQVDNIFACFQDFDKLCKLETYFPEDKIEIKLKIDKSEYKELSKLSDGQKATALLLLLFADENRLLIIDQPEDDLDNRFIFENVIKILRDMKSKRQLIIASHNANITVLGDSEQIFVLDTVDRCCKVTRNGSIDIEDVKLDVKNIMEGGEEAFRIRSEKYGYY